MFASIVDGPITPAVEGAALRPVAQNLEQSRHAGETGATVRFEGIVRALESGRELDALEYQAYEPMAQRELEKLAAEVGRTHGLTSITALHSRGRVAVGRISFVLAVSSPHRAEALSAAGEFIDRLKNSVPIWKRPLWQDVS